MRCGSDCRPVRGKAPSSGYDTSYLFPVTRTLADRCWHPALTVPLTPLTLVADIVELPFGLVLGFF